MTNRDKIIQYLKEHGIDILPYEVDESYAKQYKKPGTILINAWYCFGARKDMYFKVQDLCGYGSPIELKTPYKKDSFGNVSWFEREHCYARIVWKPERRMRS